MNNQLVWSGKLADTVSGLNESQKQVNKGVKELIKHFGKAVARSEKQEA